MISSSRRTVRATKQSDELNELRCRLAIAEETLAAIRNGAVDALLVSGAEGDQVFTLKGAERSYRLLMEAMNEGAATVLRDGTILYCNRRFASMAGRELGQMIGSSLIDLVSVEHRAALRSNLPAVTANGYKAEFDLCGTDGAALPVHLSFSVLDVEDVSAVAVVATDLIERKKYERALLAQNEELERRVEQRTKDLMDANQKLQAAEAKIRQEATDLEAQVSERTAELRESMGSLEQFCYTIAHDLRAPLRTMHGFSNALLNDSPLDDTSRNYAQRIVAAASRMDLLIRDLLVYGRLNSADLESVPVNPVSLLEEVARSAEARNAKFEIKKPMPLIRANPTGLKQIFENLLANATKFVAPGVVPHVCICADERDACVRINIKDNGIGIEEKYHHRIFRVFERLFPSQYPGTGIGLAIVQKGVERMGGRVGVESQSGQGSCFWIELPKA